MPVHEKPVGASVDWFTPRGLFEALGVNFDLDPAGGRDIADLESVNRVPARRFITADQDGLAQPWRGSVWLNPPYGPAGVRFIERMIQHDNGLLLIPARTETRIFQRAATAAASICFLRDRLHFVRPDGTSDRAPFASALLAFGQDWRLVLALADLGWTVDKHHQWPSSAAA